MSTVSKRRGLSQSGMHGVLGRQGRLQPGALFEWNVRHLGWRDRVRIDVGSELHDRERLYSARLRKLSERHERVHYSRVFERQVLRRSHDLPAMRDRYRLREASLQ